MNHKLSNKAIPIFRFFFVPLCLLCSLYLAPTIAIGQQITFAAYQKIDDASLDVRFSHLLFIVDQSSSMFNWDDGISRFEQQRQLLLGLTEVLPAYTQVKIGLRAFGGRTKSKDNRLAPGHALQLYDATLLEKWLDELKPDIGDLPMQDAIKSSLQDLAARQGQNIALFLLSDGMDKADGVSKLLTDISQTIGKQNDICLFILEVGNGGKYSPLLKSFSISSKLDSSPVSDANCNIFLQNKELKSNAGMQSFVRRYILERVPDSDKDGVYDHSDKCHATPQQVHVDANGCPLDQDADGIADYQDQCPDTEAQRKVNKDGCFVIPKSFVVLVENTTGGVGAVSFGNKLGKQNINQANMAIGMNDSQAPNKPFAMSKKDIQNIFSQTMQNLPKEPIMLSVYFSYNKDSLPKTERRTFRKLVREIRKRNSPEILIIGHTDTVGSMRYNHYLATQRALEVWRLLVSVGVDSKQMRISARPESTLSSKTDLDTLDDKYSANKSSYRRVDIHVR
ncbi:MAG: OmpA family protein [Mariprofundales bacterium]